MYVIDKLGGKATFVTGGNVTWPADIRFSPDGRFLAAAIDLQLAIVEVSTGSVTMPVYTDNWVRFPDWSPDGRFIVYCRLGWTYPEPPDSAGLRIYELATGRDWPIVHNGQVVGGVAPRWSPNGDWIAFITTNPNEVGIVRPDGSERRTLLEGECFERELVWYQRRLTGANGVVCVDLCRGTYFVDPTNGRAVPTHPLGVYDEFSPDGSEFVTIGLQQPDSLGVIFTQSVDDFSGATRFQVTRYAPPPPSAISHLSRTVKATVQLLGTAPH